MRRAPPKGTDTQRQRQTVWQAVLPGAAAAAATYKLSAEDRKDRSSIVRRHNYTR